MKKQEEFKRQFGGKLDNFESKQERAFEQKHLHNYLRGNTRFKFGYKNIETPYGVQRVPAWYAVKEEWVENI